MSNYLLAIVMGCVLRFISTFGVGSYIDKSSNNSELKSYFGFHVCVIGYAFGTVLKYGGIAFILATLVKNYVFS